MKTNVVAVAYLAALLVASRTAARSEEVAAAAAAAASAAADSKPAVDGADSSGANATGVAEKVSSYSAPFVAHSSGDVSGQHDLGRTLFASAVVFGGLALAAAFVWLVAPLFGYKWCAIVGNCSDNGGGSSVGGAGSGVGNGEDSVIVNGGEEASSLFPFSVGYRHNAPYASYRKRSLNYVGPILKTLSSAYEKFEEFSSTTPKAA